MKLNQLKKWDQKSPCNVEYAGKVFKISKVLDIFVVSYKEKQYKLPEYSQVVNYIKYEKLPLGVEHDPFCACCGKKDLLKPKDSGLLDFNILTYSSSGISLSYTFVNTAFSSITWYNNI